MKIVRIAGRVAALAIAVLTGSAAAQDAPASSELRTVRVTLVDRQNPERRIEDASASLSLTYRSGRSETRLLTRVPGNEDAPMGDLRGLVGTGSYVELSWDGARGVPEAAPAQGSPAREILRRAHRGPAFIAAFPASRIGEIRSAVVSIRLGSRSWSSEEFPGPSSTVESKEAVLAGVERSFRGLQERVEQGAGYLSVRPALQRLTAQLGRLAPEGFLDETGTFELERQRGLALARALEDASSSADGGRVAALSLQGLPIVQRMKAFKPAAAPGVPTVDPQE